LTAKKQDDSSLAAATAAGDPVMATKPAVPRPSLLSRVQARIGRRLLSMIGRRLFGFNFEFQGLEHVPAGEPVIVAAAPHRGWIDSFLIIMALPPSPRVYYLGSAQAMFNRWWKRVILGLMGGVVPVSSLGQLNREGLETSLEILNAGGSLGVFPEGWGHLDDLPTEIGEFKRGVAFLAQRSGRRVLPVGLAGTHQLWRGKRLLLQVGSPLDPPAPSAGRAEQHAFTDRLRTAVQAVAPPPPVEPEGAGRTWQWLTKLLG
jgi:1-acyl-sn-glycerol-3-phosphate acyltransferase